MLAEMDREHWNHPSAYGGYNALGVPGVTGCESSLRIRRVRYAALLVCECYENHPSAYGGYCRRAGCIAPFPRIIPPHTEGT